MLRRTARVSRAARCSPLLAAAEKSSPGNGDQPRAAISAEDISGGEEVWRVSGLAGLLAFETGRNPPLDQLFARHALAARDGSYCRELVRGEPDSHRIPRRHFIGGLGPSAPLRLRAFADVLAKRGQDPDRYFLEVGEVGRCRMPVPERSG